MIDRLYGYPDVQLLIYTFSEGLGNDEVYGFILLQHCTKISIKAMFLAIHGGIYL